MKRRSFGLLMGGVAGLRAQRQEKTRFAEEYPVAPRTVDIEVGNGPVTVILGRAPGIRVEAEIEYQGATEEDVALARQEVKFAPRLEGEVFRVWVERAREHYGNRYQARHAVRVEAPAGVKILARTASGAVRLQWQAGPQADVYAKTANGDIELAFGQSPDADFRLRTRHGGVYSAFALRALPDDDEVQVTNDGMRRIVSRATYTGGRAGRGGARIQVETVNGDIRLVERK
jgi:hypothetical protein